MDAIERLAALKKYYSEFLAEDKQDGTSFDCLVLDAIDELASRISVSRPYSKEEMKSYYRAIRNGPA